jgi:DNA-binding transcriptional MerR regulator/methylmalonyl-CoA mutase cobalamin-binding subunit
MYTIGQASARTGVSVQTIRAWERRYGVVEPVRTAAGYRLYDDVALRRLAVMRSLVTEGWRPSDAAEHLDDRAVDLATVSGVPTGHADHRFGGDMAPAHVAVETFVDAARRVDDQAMERILDEAFATERFELAMDRVVFPALRGIGLAWSVGELDVAGEHAATETLRRRLARFFDAAGAGGGRSQVLVGMPPGGRHELGAYAFAVACRRAGTHVLYLGVDVPGESWLRTARETVIPVVVLGVVTAADASAAAAVVDALGMLDRPPVCFGGGPAAHDLRLLSGASELPPGMDDAVAVVHAALERAEGRVESPDA